MFGYSCSCPRDFNSCGLVVHECLGWLQVLRWATVGAKLLIACLTTREVSGLHGLSCGNRLTE